MFDCEYFTLPFTEWDLTNSILYPNQISCYKILINTSQIVEQFYKTFSTLIQLSPHNKYFQKVLAFEMEHWKYSMLYCFGIVFKLHFSLIDFMFLLSLSACSQYLIIFLKSTFVTKISLLWRQMLKNYTVAPPS